MGFFDHLHKNGTSSIKSQSPTIRKQVLRAPAGKERLSTPAGPSPLSRPLSRSVTPRTNGTPSRGASPAISRTGSPRSSSSRSVARKRGSPAQQRLESSSSESESQEDFDAPPRKRTRHSIEPDLNRNVLCDTSFLEEPTELSFVHAADITSNNKGDSYSPAFTEHDPSLEILLRYPSSSNPERFQVVHPRDRDDFNPLEDMIQVIDSVCHYYLPKAESDTLRDDSSGFARRLKRALAHQSEQEYRDVVSEYNDLITQRRRDGTISRELRSLHRLDLELVERILTQTYSRIVSPRVGTLRHYENGTDNVYGELLPLFVSKIFADTKIKSQHLFVDLGSGVGNVVLQAALEIGCESWGCEMMDGPCKLADLQQEEFEVRCKLWGLSIGKIHLERGDFLKNSAIAAILPKADVVLVNNQAFTPGLNDSLLRLFLDLKEGCQIVSLKSFVPHGHKITSRNFNSPVNLLQVEAKQYWSRSVSWTDAAGTYHIARKDSRMLRDFAKKERLSRSSS